VRWPSDADTFSEVLSENVATVAPPTGDRRTRKRAARSEQLLELAFDLLEEGGIAAVTMTALAEAADYAPASLYTYFSSRSALLAAMQRRALAVLHEAAVAAAERWQAALAGLPTTPPARAAALAPLFGFSDLFLAAPRAHPREFVLQQQLLVTADAEEAVDAATVVPAAMGVLDVPRGLLATAVAAGALDAPADAVDPLAEPVDGNLVRTFAWIVALNGSLLVEGLATGLPTTGAALGAELTASLLRGWGADPTDLAAARAIADGWDDRPEDATS
jgi:AcrR family transcriptional regulator